MGTPRARPPFCLIDPLKGLNACAGTIAALASVILNARPDGDFYRFIPGLTSSELPVCLAAVEDSVNRLHEIQDDDYFIDPDGVGGIVDGGNRSKFKPAITPLRMCLGDWLVV